MEQSQAGVHEPSEQAMGLVLVRSDCGLARGKGVEEEISTNQEIQQMSKGLILLMELPPRSHRERVVSQMTPRILVWRNGWSIISLQRKV